MAFLFIRSKKYLFALFLSMCAIFILWKLGFINTNLNSVPSNHLEIFKDSSGKPSLLEYRHGNPIDLAIIFRHGKDKEKLQNHLHVAMDSILAYSSIPVRLHIVTDEESFKVASRIIDALVKVHQKSFEVVFVSTEKVRLLSAEESTLSLLQEFFTSRSQVYYRDPLFFFSLFLYDILPGLKRVILMDIDVRFEADIAELETYFSRFESSHVMAMTHELSPAYLHALERYRKDNPHTRLGSASSEGGFPGYNSGIMLVDIERLKQSAVIKSYLERSVLYGRSDHYKFRGDLGDQDLYTLIAFDHPELFYTLPCQWNRQLCQWWRDKGYAHIFDRYFACPGRIKVYHGNCGSVMPSKVKVN